MSKKGSTEMSSYAKLVAEAGDQFLNTLTQAQEQFLKSMSTFAAMVPAVPSLPTPPFAVDLPTPKEVADANFAFAAKLLSQQKAFTDKLFSAGV